ncbi:hypothetical protein FDUTEX481_02606 [Tolypothrix sp. PCC 7601]|nr:hypothetical protein FDUTEX481_02606 [Tolypothrix sp. PCC 7601]
MSTRNLVWRKDERVRVKGFFLPLFPLTDKYCLTILVGVVKITHPASEIFTGNRQK